MRRRTLAVSAVFAAATAFAFVAAAPASAAPPNDPVGALEAITARGTSTLTVKGWALDRDRTSWAVRVQASVDGVDDPAGAVLASAWRPDVGAAQGVGPAHGYSLQVQAPPTAKRVCVKALNVTGTPGADSVLGCLAIPASARLVDKVNRVQVNVPGVGLVTSIQVYPTAAGRNAGVAHADVWNAVKAASAAFLGDVTAPGMYEQFMCHRNFASTKPSWNLEPLRVAMSYAATVSYACNPPFRKS